MRNYPASVRPPGRAAAAVIAGTCCVSMFMIAIDTTVVNMALPLIGRGLHAPVAGRQWTIAAYTITTASLMLTSGAIGDRYGRRTVLQAGLARRQAGQSLGVSVVGAILAERLHGTIRGGFAGASRPAWLVIATCGFVVLLLSLMPASGGRYEPRHARAGPNRRRGRQFGSLGRIRPGSRSRPGERGPGRQWRRKDDD